MNKIATRESLGILEDIALPSGQRLSIQKQGRESVLTIHSAGRTLVSLRINEQGAEVLLADGCAIRSSGDMSLEADVLTLKARKHLQLQSDGDTELLTKGDLHSEARIQTLKSTLGNVNIKANDDVKMRAERICLNT